MACQSPLLEHEPPEPTTNVASMRQDNYTLTWAIQAITFGILEVHVTLQVWFEIYHWWWFNYYQDLSASRRTSAKCIGSDCHCHIATSGDAGTKADSLFANIAFTIAQGGELASLGIDCSFGYLTAGSKYEVHGDLEVEYGAKAKGGGKVEFDSAKNLTKTISFGDWVWRCPGYIAPTDSHVSPPPVPTAPAPSSKG